MEANLRKSEVQLLPMKTKPLAAVVNQPLVASSSCPSEASTCPPAVPEQQGSQVGCVTVDNKRRGPQHQWFIQTLHTRRHTC